jgi:cyclopropane fatty-acyl-phospholipid synthase-like methyltransferase
MNNMSEWSEKLFIRRADLSLKIMNLRWPYTEKIVEGMVKILSEHDIDTGKVLDLCCGNGRISTHFAKKGFNAVGVDFSKSYLDDARKHAEDYGVSDSVEFVEGDVRDLKEVLKDHAVKFDVVVSAWTSIGYTTFEDDLSVFKQARALSTDDSILFVIETMHTGRASLIKSEHSFIEFDEMMMLDNSTYDPLSSIQTSSWTFYRKKGKDLEYVDRLDYKVYIHSLKELSSMLDQAGWRVDAFYGDISTFQSMSPYTSMNIVARAK